MKMIGLPIIFRIDAEHRSTKRAHLAVRSKLSGT
jgi:hypothetical protein